MFSQSGQYPQGDSNPLPISPNIGHREKVTETGTRAPAHSLAHELQNDPHPKNIPVANLLGTADCSGSSKSSSQKSQAKAGKTFAETPQEALPHSLSCEPGQSGTNDPDLARLIDAWPALSAETRHVILALVNAFGGGAQL